MKHLKKFNESKQFKPIELITKVAVEQPVNDPGQRITMDLLDIVQSIGHDDIPFTLDWSDGYNQLWKDYLVGVYGEDIKNHEEFILLCY